MLQPNPGKLLRSLAASLTDAVLPELEKGNGYRQLKAAIHLLKRLQRTWDLYNDKVHSDNTDFLETCGSVIEIISGTDYGQKFSDLQLQLKEVRTGAIDDASVDGINDPELARATRTNLDLQALTCELEQRLAELPGDDPVVAKCCALLSKLYRRLVLRDSVYIGDKPVVE
ncbi:MAG: hypothetical protein WC965_13245 [Thiohalomonadaceae bacterium]